MLAIVDDNIKKQCVLIIGYELLLSAGVERLISVETRLCVLGIASLGGANLLDIVKHLQPDTVILDKTYFVTLSLKYLVELLDYPQVRVIAVSANDDQVQMYYKQQIRIICMAELAHFIRAGKKNGYRVYPAYQHLPT